MTMKYDKDKRKTLPQQGVLGDPAAGVEGITVPGAPTSSSYKGLTGVSTAGTPEEMATAVKSSAAPEENPDMEQAQVEEILHNITVGYESALDALEAKTPRTVSMDMDVVQEENTPKKRKAVASPIVDDSSSDEVIRPHVPRGVRRSRLSDPVLIGNIDLTRDSATPTNVGDTDLADADSDTPGPSSKGRKEPNKPRKKKTLKDVESNPDLDEVTYDELLSMGANDAGAIGLKCMDLLHEMRGFCQGQLNGKMKPKIHAAQKVINALIAKALSSSGDSAPLETRLREVVANLETTKGELARCRSENGTLKSENINLRSQIDEIRAEMGKVEEIRFENESLRKQVSEIRRDLRNLKKVDPRKEIVSFGGSRKDGKLKSRDRLTSGGYGSPVAGPSGTSVHRSSAEAVKVAVVTENKKETGKKGAGKRASRVSETFKDSKDVARDKDSSGDACLAMDWEALPQRLPRPGPRVVANVQLVPPRGLVESDREKSDTAEDTRSRGTKKGRRDSDGFPWSSVPKKQRRRKSGGSGNPKTVDSRGDPKGNPGTGIVRSKPNLSAKKRLPKTAAVTITGRSSDFSYKDALMKARREISLADLKIGQTRLRRAANGGYLIEILDADGADKAKTLQKKLRGLLPEEEATVACPVISGELRFIGLDDTITTEEVAQFIASEGKCDIGEVRVGTLRLMRNGLNMAWAKCPLVAASKIASKKKAYIGWTCARVELLRARPIQCFRCWGFGHVRFSCSAQVDRSRCCFNCGEDGHSLKDCQRPPRCVICAAEGRKDGHRTGSAPCEANRQVRPTRTRYGTSEASGPDRREGGVTDSNNEL
ncbi:gag-pol polyprotein [Lasius niger]|uniref:Gag-pol polyprotein n=1 Tax=Lasius niger TaxID=67767 RepID=A0A0J7KI55_LASNI|nr:gag-pol polyprotein [Lasius niger]